MLSKVSAVTFFQDLSLLNIRVNVNILHANSLMLVSLVAGCWPGPSQAAGQNPGRGPGDDVYLADFLIPGNNY